MNSSPPLTDPIAQFAWHRINGKDWPITLIVGSNWITATSPETYMVNADEPATYDEVETMLIEAGGIGHFVSTQ
ncbi:hypothetical protein DZC76_03340 [Pseudomonas sp. phDV1]|nr:hypothetical protein DZC76_03340 [Pseudomonas sp. phDV1]